MGELHVIPVRGIPEVGPGDDLSELLLDAIRGGGLDLRGGDIVAGTQKVGANAEGPEGAQGAAGEGGGGGRAEGGRARAGPVRGRVVGAPGGYGGGVGGGGPPPPAPALVRPPGDDLFRESPLEAIRQQRAELEGPAPFGSGQVPRAV